MSLFNSPSSSFTLAHSNSHRHVRLSVGVPKQGGHNQTAALTSRIVVERGGGLPSLPLWRKRKRSPSFASAIRSMPGPVPLLHLPPGNALETLMVPCDCSGPDRARQSAPLRGVLSTHEPPMFRKHAEPPKTPFQERSRHLITQGTLHCFPCLPLQKGVLAWLHFLRQRHSFVHGGQLNHRRTHEPVMAVDHVEATCTQVVRVVHS